MRLRRTNSELLDLIALTLGIDVAAFYDGRAASLVESGGDATLGRLIDAFRRLPDEAEQRRVVEIVEGLASRTPGDRPLD